MNFGDRYGTMSRLLHRIAFRARTAQHALSNVADTLYADQIDGVTADNPVFITSLPRSGTTILLKLLWQTGRFASHTYQDMPFVLCPLIWSRCTGWFAEEIEPTEQARADGPEVSGESPEAFEEMIWKHFWPSYYQEDYIRPWSPGDQNQKFNSFLRTHMRKVIAVRGEEARHCLRKDLLGHEVLIHRFPASGWLADASNSPMSNLNRSRICCRKSMDAGDCTRIIRRLSTAFSGFCEPDPVARPARPVRRVANCIRPISNMDRRRHTRPAQERARSQRRDRLGAVQRGRYDGSSQPCRLGRADR